MRPEDEGKNEIRELEKMLAYTLIAIRDSDPENAIHRVHRIISFVFLDVPEDKAG